MAMFNVLQSVSNFLDDSNISAPAVANADTEEEQASEEAPNLAYWLQDCLILGKICIFTLGEKDELEQIISILKSSGVELFCVTSLFGEIVLPSANDEAPVDSDALHCITVDLLKDKSECMKEYADQLLRFSCRKSYPLVFIKGDCIGGVKELKTLHDRGSLPEYYKDHDYDLVVIGGGSGGLAAAKQAAYLGKKVAALDFVKPTPLGTTWGLGGTCVNVGCIPKKLMHQAAILGKSLQDARKFGWEFGTEVKTDWKTMTANIRNHILSLNYGYKVQLRQKNVTYLNGYGSFVDSHTIKAVQKDGKEVILTADRFLIATGLRPRYLDIPGAKEYCITSDDLFTLPYPPGKTLVVGASYVALECGGFLQGFNFDVTVMVRSILLRGFDQDIADRIGKHMEGHGIKFIRQAIPTKIDRLEEGKPGLYKVTYTQKTPEGDVESTAEYNTILLAIGRDAVTDDVNLDVVNVTRNKAKKLVCFENEQSVSAPHIYGIGDVSEGRPELTPVAIQAGRFLMNNLYQNQSLEFFDYQNVPTTVFTPMEYGACGLSEESAKEKYGDNAVIYHSRFTPLEYTVPKRQSDIDTCYAKIIFEGDEMKPKELRVVGLHYLGPNAGEVTQGFGIALKLKATMADFTSLIGIHPTTAEVFTFPSMERKMEDVPLQAGGC